MLDIGFLILYLCSSKAHSDMKSNQEKFSRIVLNPDTQMVSFVSFGDKSGFTHPYPPSLIESSVIKTKGIRKLVLIGGVVIPGK